MDDVDAKFHAYERNKSQHWRIDAWRAFWKNWDHIDPASGQCRRMVIGTTIGPHENERVDERKPAKPFLPRLRLSRAAPRDSNSAGAFAERACCGRQNVFTANRDLVKSGLGSIERSGRTVSLDKTTR